MANVIKHKRGSGSDPVASDLVVGEVAIRTDVGKLFTKMDNGSVAEIAGGGSDIAINTLSSSSGTGGGSATFNGSAYRFTLSAPPSVSAQQLLVSINGVIQKPVAGTGQPSEGFSVDGTDIILGDAPATGSDFFILTFKSLGVSEPADNSVTSAKIVDGAIVNADINASANITGTKISPNFGSQNIVSTGYVSVKDVFLTDSDPTVFFTDTTDNHNYIIQVNSGNWKVRDTTNSVDRLVVNADGHVDITGNLDVGAGIDVTGAITGTGDVTITKASPILRLADTTDPQGTDGSIGKIEFYGNDGSSGGADVRSFIQTISTNSVGNAHALIVGLSESNAAPTEKLRILGDGNVGIGTSNPTQRLTVLGGSTDSTIAILTGADTNRGFKISTATENSQTDMLVQLEAHGQHSGQYEGEISLKTGGNHRLRVDKAGNVGIGTTSPSGTLHIESSSEYCLKINKSDSTAAYIQFYNSTTGSSTSDGFRLGLDSNEDGLISLRESGNVKFSTADTERMRIDSSGRLNIGTDLIDTTMASPAGLVNIHTTNTGTHNSLTLFWDHNNLTTDIEQRIQFSLGDNASDDQYVNAGYIAIGKENTWQSNSVRSSYLSFATSNAATQAERMRIDSSGNVGIGTISPSDNLHLAESGATHSYIRFSNSNISNGWSVGAQSGGRFQIVHNGVRDSFFIDTSGNATVNSGNLVIGTAGKGIDFSATSDATGKTSELLNDYEEGTFSPAIRPGNNSTAASMTVHEANYTRVGRLVHVVAYMTINSNPSGTTGGDTRITGLPFQNIGAHGAANIHYFAGLGNNINFISGTVQGNSTEILIRATTSATTGTSNIAYADYFGGNDGIIFSATYQTSA